MVTVLSSTFSCVSVKKFEGWYLLITIDTQQLYAWVEVLKLVTVLTLNLFIYLLCIFFLILNDDTYFWGCQRLCRQRHSKWVRPSTISKFSFDLLIYLSSQPLLIPWDLSQKTSDETAGDSRNNCQVDKTNNYFRGCNLPGLLILQFSK